MLVGRGNCHLITTLWRVILTNTNLINNITPACVYLDKRKTRKASSGIERLIFTTILKGSFFIAFIFINKSYIYLAQTKSSIISLEQSKKDKLSHMTCKWL